MQEVDWQTKIVNRVKEQGGYGAKWATQFSVGKPDLILTHGDTLFVEVKYETDWFKNTARTLGFTSKQNLEAQRINEAGGRCFGLVVIQNGLRDVKLCPVEMPDPRSQLRIKLQILQSERYDWYADKDRYKLFDYLSFWSNDNVRQA